MTDAPVPLAYLITFTCYGTHLHGAEAGSVDRYHNTPGTPHLAADGARVRVEQARMSQPAYQLNGKGRQRALQTIIDVSAHRTWALFAAHVRATHIHTVVHAHAAPERVMNDFKAYISRRLTERGNEATDRKRWSRHGSTRYLWKPVDVEAAIRYVVHEQGEPMAVFENGDRLIRCCR